MVMLHLYSKEQARKTMTTDMEQHPQHRAQWGKWQITARHLSIYVKHIHGRSASVCVEHLPSHSAWLALGMGIPGSSAFLPHNFPYHPIHYTHVFFSLKTIKLCVKKLQKKDDLPIMHRIYSWKIIFQMSISTLSNCFYW